MRAFHYIGHMASFPKQYLVRPLLARADINAAVFRLDFDWPGPVPAAGQFFMLKAPRGASFLGRPLSVYRWDNSRRLSFLILKKGRGTEELSRLRPGEEAALTGPLGNRWRDFTGPGIGGGSRGGAGGTSGKIALVAGGIGIAPLSALGNELGGGFDLYAGFKSLPFGLESLEEKADELVIASEDGSGGRKGRIPDFLEAGKYRALFACGPEPMLQALAEKSGKAGVPCYISMERRMACGVGACLGCTVETAGGNRRCCADGPIFPAREIYFNAPSASDGPIFPAREIYTGEIPAKEIKLP
jgi:NAD(P)H-flavin reductase